MEVSQFFADFWPNFTATMLGLIIGLPAGLWTNRFVIRKQIEIDSANQRETWIEAMRMLKETLVENRGRLEKAIESVSNDYSSVDLLLDFSAWDVVQSNIVQYKHNTTLKKRLAYHFSRLGTLSLLNTKHYESSFGISSALQNSGKTRSTLKDNILDTAKGLLSDTNQIIALIDVELPK